MAWCSKRYMLLAMEVNLALHSLEVKHHSDVTGVTRPLVLLSPVDSIFALRAISSTKVLHTMLEPFQWHHQTWRPQSQTKTRRVVMYR